MVSLYDMLHVGIVGYVIVILLLVSCFGLGVIGRILGWSDGTAPIKANVLAKARLNKLAQAKLDKKLAEDEVIRTKQVLNNALNRIEYLENRLHYTQSELLFIKKQKVKELTKKPRAVTFRDVKTLEPSVSLSESDLTKFVTIMDTEEKLSQHHHHHRHGETSSPVQSKSRIHRDKLQRISSSQSSSPSENLIISKENSITSGSSQSNGMKSSLVKRQTSHVSTPIRLNELEGRLKLNHEISKLNSNNDNGGDVDGNLVNRRNDDGIDQSSSSSPPLFKPKVPFQPNDRNRHISEQNYRLRMLSRYATEAEESDETLKYNAIEKRIEESPPIERASPSVSENEDNGGGDSGGGGDGDHSIKKKKFKKKKKKKETELTSSSSVTSGASSSMRTINSENTKKKSVRHEMTFDI